MTEIDIRKGFLKSVRIGDLNFRKQPKRLRKRAPETQGIWAFPWPYSEPFFSHHKFEEAMPKNLWYRFSLPIPCDRQWIVDDETGSPIEDDRELDEDGFPSRAHVSVKLFEERDRWMKDIARRVVRKTTFWYRGDLYTHLTESGGTLEVGMKSSDPAEWELVSAREFADRVSRNLFEDSAHFRNNDRFEIFIPRGRGRIRSRL